MPQEAADSKLMGEIQELKEEMETILLGLELLKIMDMMAMLIPVPEAAAELDVQLEVLEAMEVQELLY